MKLLKLKHVEGFASDPDWHVRKQAAREEFIALLKKGIGKHMQFRGYNEPGPMHTGRLIGVGQDTVWFDTVDIYPIQEIIIGDQWSEPQ